MALPYDDRGMDVVGPNKALLSVLYNKHYQYLLEHDRAEIDATFGEKLDTGSRLRLKIKLCAFVQEAKYGLRTPHLQKG